MIKDIEKDFDKADFKLKIAELSGNLADSHLALIEAQQKIESMSVEISELKKNFENRDELIEINGFEYTRQEGDKPVGTPFCPHCMNYGKRRKLYKTKNATRPTHCHECKGDFHATIYLGN